MMQVELAPRDALWDLVNGHFVAQAIHVTAKLAIADRLGRTRLSLLRSWPRIGRP